MGEVGIVSKREAEHHHWRQGCDGWHLINASGLSVIHERMSSGAAEERHLHRTSRQFFFVLSGEVVLETGGQREVPHAHEGVEVPPGIPHQVFNESDDAEFVVVSRPPSHGYRVPAAVRKAEEEVRRRDG